MNTGELFNKEVLDSNAKKVGQVVDIDFDLQNGNLNHIIVQTGIFKKHNVDVGKIDKIGDKLILSITKSDIGETK
ncbi:PRC-barrel domain-containing protein [Chloroflexota bacterium]